MRVCFVRGLLSVGLLALGACAHTAPPDRVFAVFFTEQSVELNGSAQAVVASAAAAAKQFPKLGVNVAGYADRNAKPDTPVQLSQARADAVTALLVADGIAQARIKRTALGTPPDSQPGIESRRVEIDIGDD